MKIKQVLVAFRRYVNLVYKRPEGVNKLHYWIILTFLNLNIIFVCNKRVSALIHYIVFHSISEDWNTNSIIIAWLHSNTSPLRGSVFCRRWPFLSLSGVTALGPRVHRLFDVSEVRFSGNSQNQRIWGGNLLEYVLLKPIPPKKISSCLAVY